MLGIATSVFIATVMPQSLQQPASPSNSGSQNLRPAKKLPPRQNTKFNLDERETVTQSVYVLEPVRIDNSEDIMFHCIPFRTKQPSGSQDTLVSCLKGAIKPSYRITKTSAPNTSPIYLDSKAASFASRDTLVHYYNEKEAKANGQLITKAFALNCDTRSTSSTVFSSKYLCSRIANGLDMLNLKAGSTESVPYGNDNKDLKGKDYC